MTRHGIIASIRHPPADRNDSPPVPPFHLSWRAAFAVGRIDFFDEIAKIFDYRLIPWHATLRNESEHEDI
ncbi:hypothetical protein SBV1_2040011 [Verrucomicrobia bacterium]|nr:hypothetical protein SBV1_2040011 [Verrucomicrobiota bacterium]